jgi:hypothetical protein
MVNLAAIRQQRYRERQEDGRVVLHVDVDEHALAEALIAAGFLSQDDASRASLTTALEHVISLWISGHY